MEALNRSLVNIVRSEMWIHQPKSHILECVVPGSLSHPVRCPWWPHDAGLSAGALKLKN